jgi:hypothetical protein
MARVVVIYCKNPDCEALIEVEVAPAGGTARGWCPECGTKYTVDFENEGDD